MSFVYRENKEELNKELFEAAEDGDVEKCRRFIEKGADVDAKNVDLSGGSPAHAAARNGNCEVIRVLAEAGANLNLEDEFGLTAAMYAALSGHTDTVRVLAEVGANLNHANKNDLTATMWAAMFGHSETVKVLAELGKG